MEAQGIAQTTGGGGGGGGDGRQVRRLHVIYFLSRRGRMEHPHLIRVHHLSKNGIRLRDVKRWLRELRGKDMPESFAWSYKRRYKTGYVWQDLLDEDLITPISDNEFILKGSEIPSNVFDRHSHSDSGKTVPMGKELLSDARDHTLKRKEEQIPQHPEMKSDVSTTRHCEFIEEEEEKEEDLPFFGSETSTMSDDSVKLKDESQERTKNEKDKQERSDHFGDKYSSYYSTILMFDKRNKNKNKNENENVEQEASSFTRSKSYSSGVASTMFRNLITCGAAETEDSAMMTINRRDKIKSHNNSSSTNSINSAEVCKLDKLGGSERMFRTPHNQQPPNYNARRSWDGVKSSSNYKPKSNYRKPVPAAYKPTNKPICSQCGKMFKPEKMHAHMRCCKGMKSMPKASASCPVAVPVASVQESISGQLLLH